MTTLSVAPILDRELAERTPRTDVAEPVCAAALDVGILVERGAQLELHPLARAFLAERSEQLGLRPGPDAGACLDIYRARSEWDAAFEVIVRWGRSPSSRPLLRSALDDLLGTGGVPTSAAVV